MNPIVYNIPIDLVDAFRGQKVIVRTHEPSELVRALPDRALAELVGVQLLGLDSDAEALSSWGYGIPVELVMTDPRAEFGKLYRYAKLLDKHPMRVSLPVVPGFAKAVKVAAALQLVVKLEPGQPDPAVIGEMSEVLSFFLHHGSVGQPIEFFHSLLLAMLRNQPVTLWEIQEEDPTAVRYVLADGTLVVPRPPFGTILTGNLGNIVEIFGEGLLAEQGECAGCEFFGHCGGYFKWPRRDFSCEGVKAVLGEVKAAAEELRGDLEAFARMTEGGQV
jgi:hypothetical protein